MKKIISELEQRLEYLKKLESSTEKMFEENSLSGRIKINASSKYPQIYLIKMQMIQMENTWVKKIRI